MSSYIEALKAGEDFLLEQLRRHAAGCAFKADMSRKEEDWEITVSEIVRLLIGHLLTIGEPDKLHVKEDPKDISISAFGIKEAIKYRESGLSSHMFLVLAKILRRSFMDLLFEAGVNKRELKQALALTLRFFDEFELGFYSEWTHREKTEREKAEEEFEKQRQLLEKLIEERTAEFGTAINFLRDEIDYRHKAEETLKEKEAKIRHMHGMKVLGEIAAGVAHEVRNPLHALMSVTEALKMELQDNPDVELYLFHINEQVKRLSSLMNDLLDLGKPLEPSNLRLESLVEICRASVELWRTLPSRNEQFVTLQQPGPDSDYRVMADGRRLQQVFLNLLDNAAQHSQQGATVRIIINEHDTDTIRIEVVDEGSGIPGELLPKVFDPFFSTRRGGTGLGLSIIKNIIESHGGKLMLRNNSPLQGCTAEVILPLSEE